VSRARKQDRFSSTLAVSYREPTSGEPSLGTCADISPSGMFIETTRPAARGVLVRFECISQATQGIVRGTARVMWLRPHSEATGKAGMGVRFVRLEPGSARVIEELIAHANTSGTRAKSDGPEARATTEEPSVVLTAERTIGPTNRSSSVPPKGLRAPTLRGMYPTDVRSISSSAPPPKDRKAFDSGPPREPAAAHSGPAPRANDEAERRSSRPPGDKVSSHSQALRDKVIRRGDETPTGSHRTEQPASRETAPEASPAAAAAAPAADPDARITAPDGSAFDPHREKDAPAPARSLGATMHDTVQPTKLSKSGPRRGSDNTLGVPSPPPPPWKARHSERPPGPGGVEVIRAVPVTTDAQGQPVPHAAQPEHAAEVVDASSAHSNVAEVVDSIPASPASELPGAGDPSPTDWEPMSDSGRPAMRPDRGPPDISEPFLLPASTEPADSKPGRNWIPWFVVGSGLLVTFLITMALGRPSLSIPSFTGTSDTKTNEALSAENAFAPQKQPEEPTTPVEPKQVVVQLQVEPLGAKVSALGQTIISPGKLALAYETVKWPLRVRVELAGYGAAEVVLPRQAFTIDGDSMLHELYLELQPIPAGAPQPSPQVVSPAPRPERKPSAKPGRTAPQPPKPPEQAAPAPAPEPSSPSMISAPPPGAPEPAAEAAQTPLARALECLSRGDNACVLETLGNASGARELELLIETYRATGDGSSAEAAMRRYLQVHPEGKRAAQYRRALGVVAPLPEPKPE
jgi:hypothetical protein